MTALSAALPISRLPLLVTGAHRTGTTWVGKMLAASGEAAYISEPLNVLHRRGVMDAPVHYWYQYLCGENETQYLPALRQTLAFHYRWWAEMRSLHSRRDVLRMGRDGWTFTRAWLRRQRPLLKDPFAIFSIPWFMDRLGCQVVVTVRHPAAFASSLKRLDWPFDFRDLLAQPLLMDHLLEAQRGEMQSLVDHPDLIGQASLLWRLVYQAVEQYRQQRPGVLVVRHEDLSLDPVSGYRQLYQQLGLCFDGRVEQAILSSSSSENPQELSQKKVHSVRLDSRANLHNWKRRLEPAEIERVRLQTADLAARYYPEMDWD
jgi:hypothetical protein